MKLFTKSLVAALVAAAMGAAVAADVQTVSVKTGAGQDISITTQDDGTLVVFDGQNTLTGAAAASFLQSQGVTLTVSSTGVIMGLSFADGAGTVTAKPSFVSATAQATAEAASSSEAAADASSEATSSTAAASTSTSVAVASFALPANTTATSATMSQTFNSETGSKVDDKTASN